MRLPPSQISVLGDGESNGESNGVPEKENPTVSNEGFAKFRVTFNAGVVEQLIASLAHAHGFRGSALRQGSTGHKGHWFDKGLIHDLLNCDLMI